MRADFVGGIVLGLVAAALMLFAADVGSNTGKADLARRDCQARGFSDGKVDARGLVACSTERLRMEVAK